jgi:hypothetical protein
MLHVKNTGRSIYFATEVPGFRIRQSPGTHAYLTAGLDPFCIATELIDTKNHRESNSSAFIQVTRWPFFSATVINASVPELNSITCRFASRTYEPNFP